MGEVKTCLLSSKVYPEQGVYEGSIIDITERKKTEETLRKSEEKYRDLANFLPEVVFETDLTGKITFFSKRSFELTDLTTSELEKGVNMLSFVAPEDRERAIENMKNSIAGEEDSAHEYTLIRKNGEHFPVLVRTSPIISENKVTGLRGLVVDITNRKKIESDLKESRDKLELTNEKLRVVGSLTRHDVRNKLSTVKGYTYLLKKKHKDQADILEGLNKIEMVVADSVKIFEFARMYEQLGIEELTRVDIGKAVNEAVALFQGLTIRVVNDCIGLSVLADSFLRQMFYNFIDNTRKYGEKATTIKVCCEKEDSVRLMLVYEDDGVGISAENKSKLFMEGFSTGGSTGFGLFFIKKMMDVYGWQIQENGTAGEGAKFTVTIPKLNKKGKENYQITQSV
jgi:PAS domain S-box-containing protein